MRAFLRRLLYLPRRPRHDVDLRDEMETHRSLRQDQLERDGVPPLDARPASHRAFGNATLAREDARGVWMLSAFDGLWQDIRGAFRASRRVPVSSATIVLTLVFGLGLASAIFAFGDGYLSRPLPFPDDQQLYVVRTNEGVAGRMRANEVDVLRGSAIGHLGFVTSGGDREPLTWAGWLHVNGRRVEVHVGGVSNRFAQVVGVPLIEGRPFGPDDHRGEEPVPVWLSHRFWQREFGGDPAVLNRTLSFQKVFNSDQRVSVVVIGVTDPRVTTFSLNLGAGQSLPDIFAPALEYRDRADNVFAMPIVRLPQNMRREQVEAAIGTVLQGARPAPPGEVRSVRLQSLREHMAGAGRPTAVLFLAGALLALALVTVNLVHLLLARGVARAGEIAMRSALGASQWRIARLLFIESFVYGAAGIVGGLLVGRWLTHTIAAGIPTRGSDTSNLALVAMSFDSRVVVFAVVAGVIVTLFGAAWPVWRTVRVSGASHHTQRRSAARLSSRFSKLTLTCEVAISTVILMGTAFVGLGIWKHVNQPIGYDLTDRFTLSFPPSSTSSDGSVDWHGVLEGVRGVPGVRSASVDRIEPVRGRLYADGNDLSDRDVAAYSVGAAWLETRGVDLVMGRWIEPGEIEAHAPLTIVDTRFANAVWPDQDPIGKSIRVDGDTARTVVGVVSHQRFSLAREVPGMAHLPQARVEGRQSLLLWAPGLTAAELGSRLTGPLQVLAAGYESIVRGQSFERAFSDDLADARFQRPIVIALGAFALTLASVGLFGLVAYLIEQRTREFGIRLALGAGMADVTKAVVWQSAIPGVAGLVIGLAASWALEGVARATMSGWESSGFVAMVVVSGTVLLAVVLAAAGPAARVLRIDPAVVLRAE